MTEKQAVTHKACFGIGRKKPVAFCMERKWAQGSGKNHGIISASRRTKRQEPLQLRRQPMQSGEDANAIKAINIGLGTVYLEVPTTLGV
ncbi:hypothetical protein AVEN_138963-1, partial [Araneus ventricosus]